MENKIYLSILYSVLCTIFLTIHTCKAALDPDIQSFLDRTSQATLAEDGKLNLTQLVIKYGQSIEQFDVVTEDGYILTLFHILGKKTPVLMLHGITDSANTYVIRGNTSLAITLAAAGYDVWVGNTRGNQFGRRHVSINPDTEERRFFDFSFHEAGLYDLSALIDFVRNKTRYDSIFTIAHSQGTTAHFVLTSLRPEYNERIKLFIALAPVAFLNDTPPPVNVALAAFPAVAAVLKAAGKDELLQSGTATSDLITFVCSKGVVSYIVCDFGVLFPLFGFNPKGLDQEFLTGVVPGHYPRGTSRKSFEHFDQVALRRRFAQYDYGSENQARYGSTSPPDYNLTAITAKVALFVGKDDPLSTVPNVELLRSSLRNVVYYKIMETQWSHFDFTWGKFMPEYLFPPVLDLLARYN